MKREPRQPFRFGWIWIVYALLYGASIPWYVSSADDVPIWAGLPYWAFLSLLSTLGIALFTVFVIRRFWDDTDPS